MSKTTWTKEKPTTDGYYWLRYPNQYPSIVRVGHYPGLPFEVAYHGNDQPDELRSLPDVCEWYGPITEPK